VPKLQLEDLFPDEKLFNPWKLAEEIAFDMSELSRYLTLHEDATNGETKFYYWRDGGDVPDFDKINRDIARVLTILEPKPVTVLQPDGTLAIPAPDLDGNTTALGLDADRTAYLFRGGKGGKGFGSIATKLGFAIERNNVQWIVQSVQEYDLRKQQEPEPNNVAFRIRLGWSLARPGWWALATFLTKYADFLTYVVKLRTGENITAALTRLNAPLEDSKLTGKPSPLKLEEWLRDTYNVNGKPSGAPSDAYVKATIPNLGAYIGADKDSVDSWDSAESVEVKVTPPDLGDTDWSTWE
jgi:hypothetical protein